MAIAIIPAFPGEPGQLAPPHTAQHRNAECKAQRVVSTGAWYPQIRAHA
ncbi:MAG TPA: hypothetical protein VMA73_08505 [Streptosporangiaceae bacterium]|nr:hypothetical protein [Streptosporangiaceae bacterium]